MNGSTDLAVRNGTVTQSGALAIEAGQINWTPMQVAAFGQIGIADAPEGDKQVLLHVSQRTGLDPFARQLYMIGRKENKKEKRNGQWVDVWTVKWTIQTGIEGFRVIRGRAERDEGVRGILSEPTYYDGKGQPYPIWFFQQPPVAVKMTYTVRDRNGIATPYTSILRFDEYRQTRKETRDGTEVQVLSGQWATKPVHMLEKCVEADVYRKAFPQDYSGVALEDAMPDVIPGELEPEEQQPQRQRVTAADARARAPQHVTAVVVTSDPSPAVPETPGSEQSATPRAETAGEAASPAQVIGQHLERLGADPGREARLRITSRLARRPVTSTKDLAPAELRQLIGQLADCKTSADLDGLLAEAVMADDPRGEDGTATGGN